MAATNSAQVTQPAEGTRPRARGIIINPSTGLATDYLNHFNEAIMLLEMLGSCPDCMDDFLAWRPMSYREHFAASRLADRHAAIDAYESANPNLRECLETLAGTMTAVLEATRAAMCFDLPPAAASQLADRAAAMLKPLVARAAAMINGEATPGTAHVEAPQDAIDLLMQS